MKVEVTKATEEEKRIFILSNTNQIINDCRKIDFLESIDEEIDIYFNCKNSVVSVSKIIVEKNNIIRTIFSGLIIEEGESDNLAHSIMPYYELYELIDGELIYLQKDDLVLNF